MAYRGQDDDDSVCPALSPSPSPCSQALQGYDDRDDSGSNDDDDDDGTYADGEYGVAKKKPLRKKKRALPNPVVRPKGIPFVLARPPRAHEPPAASRHHSDSDSDSEYGSRSHKKKKKARASTEDIRVSSRGGKIPNYIDDVEGFEKFEEEEAAAQSLYVDPSAQVYEEDEIEAVLGHCRDEGRESDPEDLWFENVVRAKDYPSSRRRLYTASALSDFTLNGRAFPTFITRTKPTSSSSGSGASSAWTTISRRTRYGSLASTHPASLGKRSSL